MATNETSPAACKTNWKIDGSPQDAFHVVQGKRVICIVPFDRMQLSKGQREIVKAELRLIVTGCNAHAELVEALDYLLKQTVDQDLDHGIALTEGEKEARGKALAALKKANAGTP